MQEDMRLTQFLMKLNPQFNNVRGTILLQYPLPTLSHAYRLLMQEERHKEVYDANHAVEESMSFMANKKRFSKTPHNSHNPRHHGKHVQGASSFSTGVQNSGSQRLSGSNVQGRNNRRSQCFCDHCNISGHSKERCWKIHGYPADQKGKKVAATTYEVGGTSGTQHEQENQDIQTTPNIHINPNITVDQYNHLLSSIHGSVLESIYAATKGSIHQHLDSYTSVSQWHSRLWYSP